MKIFGIGVGMDAFAGAGWLAFLGALAVIALTVIGYIKFIGKNANRSSRASKFFQFDHFFIERILKAIYLFSVICITVFSVIMPFAAAFSVASLSYRADIGVIFATFFSTLFASIIGFLVFQFLCRISFEGMMMFIRLVTDARDIRNAVAGEPGTGGVNGGSAAHNGAAATYYGTAGAVGTASARTTTQVSSAAQTRAAAPATWTCSCGRGGNTGSFCGACGKPRP